jgi:hypothetical protein
VLSALLVALTLDGALPGARSHLHALAHRLLENEEPPVPTPFGDWRRGPTRSGAGSTGARIAFFLNG